MAIEVDLNQTPHETDLLLFSSVHLNMSCRERTRYEVVVLGKK